MTAPSNRFQEFFVQRKYLIIKNLMYNYRLRKRALESALRAVQREVESERILEIGSGTSPIITDREHVVYSDLSFTALSNLKGRQWTGHYVVADGTRLPFRDGAFSQAIVSEVLEHIPDDKAVVAELARVLDEHGALLVTFPHRQMYYASDDAFVNHFRRYELPEIEERLRSVNLNVVSVQKILGVLEKAMMVMAVRCFHFLEKRSAGRTAAPEEDLLKIVVYVFGAANTVFSNVARLEAWLIPRRFATVLLVVAVK